MASRPTRKPAPRRQRKPTLFQRLRGDFLTGLVVVAPVLLTIWVVWTAITFIDARIVPLVPAIYNPSTYIGRDIAGFGVVVFLVVNTMVGALTKGLFGKQLLRWGEGLFDRTPVVRTIYNAVKQIFETVVSQSNSSFKQACLIEYPRKGIWAVAFVSTETRGEVRDKVGAGDMMSIFLPTTPNPTSGFLLFVPRSDVVVLDMSVEEAAKLIISAGLVHPGSKRPPTTVTPQPQPQPTTKPALQQK